MENTFLLVKMLLEACKAAKMAVGGATVTANVRTLNPPSLELLRASGRLQLGEKLVSPRVNDFGSVQSCQLGGAAVTAKVRTPLDNANFYGKMFSTKLIYEKTFGQHTFVR